MLDIELFHLSCPHGSRAQVNHPRTHSFAQLGWGQYVLRVGDSGFSKALRARSNFASRRFKVCNK